MYMRQDQIRWILKKIICVKIKGDFIAVIIDVSLKCGKGFDVESLFTNVPLNWSIDIITEKQPPFSRLIFKGMLKLATWSYFIYNGTLNQQIYGVTWVVL